MHGKRGLRVAAVAALALIAFATATVRAANAATAAPAAGCGLQSAKGSIKHVIYVQFDNTHFLRDRASVPSDLEQMPHLLNFMRGNGTLLTNDHTVLISHTATGILSSLTGVYPDRMGINVSNSYRYFTPSGATNGASSFAYWTDPVPTFTPFTAPASTAYNMITEDGKNAPAPWVPFTRAGCNFGAVGTANTVLENTGIDITTVFGAGSPEAAEASTNPAKAQADFVGIAVHCAAGNVLCSAANGGKADPLPDEPGGYANFSALFGAKSVDPQLSPFGPLTDLSGNVIADPAGNPGFPGFDGMLASQSLAWTAAMQEHGVPVTYTYISDAHDNHVVQGGRIRHFAYGPGEAGYAQQLRAYDDAFARFFQRLAADGIDQSNTLFVFTVDEGDHFVGSTEQPPGCNGISVPCTYTNVGEVNANLKGLVVTQTGNTTPFTVHSDVAPTVYITGNPDRTSATARDLERAMGSLTATNPYTGNVDKLSSELADQVTERTLHMVTGDPARTPSFTYFANPDYFFFTGAPNCNSPCVFIPPQTGADTFAWNHGDIQNEIATTWIGYVGPGVRRLGTVDKVWTDHTDARPTILSLVGLKDGNVLDGRTVVEPLYDWAVPRALRAHDEAVRELGAVYKQLDAPFGKFALNTLHASTVALQSNAPGDATYTSLENRIASLTSSRDALADQIRAALNAAAFADRPLSERQAERWIDQADTLIEQSRELAGGEQGGH